MLLTVSLVVLLSVAASSAPAAKHPESNAARRLDAVIDSVLVTLAKLESKQLHKDGISQLHNLHRVRCDFEGTVDASNYRCHIVAKGASLHTEDGETYLVDVHFPVTIVISQHGVIQTMQVGGETTIDVVDERAFDDAHHEANGVFGLRKKVKKAVKKALHKATKIVLDAAKEALKKKATEIAGKVITGVLVG